MDARNCIMGQPWRNNRVMTHSRIGLLVLPLLLLFASRQVHAQGTFQHVFDSVKTTRTSTVIQVADSGYIIASNGSLLKLSPLGFPIWKSDGFYSSVCKLGEGRIIAVGNNLCSIFANDGSLLFNDTTSNGMITSVASRNDTAVIAAYNSDSNVFSILLRMVTSNGTEIWKKHIPVTRNEIGGFSIYPVAPSSLVLSRENDYLVVSDSFTYAIDHSGVTTWKKPHIPGDFVEIRSGAVPNEFYVGKASNNSSYLAIHYDSEGIAIDSIKPGLDFVVSVDQIGSIADKGRGRVNAQGFHQPANLGTQPFWQEQYAPPPPVDATGTAHWNAGICITRTLDGGYIICGFYGAKIPEGYSNFGLTYVIKTDSLGNTDTLVHVGGSGPSAVASSQPEPSYLYPNPTTGRLTIRNSSAIRSIHVTNPLGIEVAQLTPPSSETEVQIDLSHVPSGIYFVSELCADGSSKSYKIQKRE